MHTLRDVQRELAEYERRYRHPDQLPLTISGLYDLFPGQPTPASALTERRWPQTWPNADGRGVYLVFDHELSLRYIGKASMRSSIGARLGTYFGYAEDRSCKILHTGWRVQPRFLVTVAVPDETPWEAPAIEEYLIKRLQPPDNSVGMEEDQNG
jgi:hypothetical protein